MNISANQSGFVVISGPQLWLSRKSRAAVHGAWVQILGWTLVAVGAAGTIPQVVRLARTRQVAGLSPTTELMWALSWALWLWYVIDLQLWPRVAYEGMGMVLSLATSGLLLTSLLKERLARPAIRTAVPLLGLSLAGVLAARWAGGTTGMAIALTVMDLVSLYPLIRTTLTAPSLAGVSVWSWTLKTFLYAGWITYALAIGNPLSAGWVFALFPVALFMLARLAIDRGMDPRRVHGRVWHWLKNGVPWGRLRSLRPGVSRSPLIR
jgi:uncharacterized protein with PQ loop repeat